jgi:putative transposase
MHAPNTYTQIYIQFVFAVKYREALIPSSNRDELHRYITGICRNHDQKVHSVFAMPDHVHLLVGHEPVISISDFMKEIKISTSRFINEKKWTRRHFNWQTGYGAFSYSRSDVDKVRQYILDQEQHHERVRFADEYKALLREFGIEYDEKYLFEDVFVG